MNWIRFTDKMPEQGEKVLVYYKDKMKSKGFYSDMEILQYYGKNKWNEDLLQDAKGNIRHLTDEPYATHWAPLPNGPNLR